MRKAIATLLVPGLTLAGLVGLAGPAAARPASPPPQPRLAAADHYSPSDRSHIQQRPLEAAKLPPLPASSKKALKQRYGHAPTQFKPRAACDIKDIISKTGPALVAAIKAADPPDCLYPLFSLTGADARSAFRESQMITVADALRDNGTAYPGDNSTKTLQLVLYLRAGYYVHDSNEADTGPYGEALKRANRAGLDAFYGNGKSGTETEDNGKVLEEAVLLITNAHENTYYLPVLNRLLGDYKPSYGYRMTSAVNNGIIVIFYGHWEEDFPPAVERDPSILTTLHELARNNLDQLGTDKDYLIANAGRELGRFVQHAPLQAKVRPMMRDLLSLSQITGRTASLWVAVAWMADSYDQANCSYYDTCDLAGKLKAAALPVSHSCGSTLKIRAQEITSGQLGDTCDSLLNQDAYFHNLVNDSGPVAGDNNTSLEVNVFNSGKDYQTYAGAIFGIDTNNGGMYLEGDPSKPGNQARFIAYEREDVEPGWQIWNLNHEYTHYLDGRFNMYGDFTAGISTPTVWWIEGFAEYVSYGYRGIKNDQAKGEAGKHTYSLGTLFDTTYDHDTTRVYPWGYLAVRYMFEKHRGNVTTVLGNYRTGNWNGARTFLKGLNYDSDFDSWLTACANGACKGTRG